MHYTKYIITGKPNKDETLMKRDKYYDLNVSYGNIGFYQNKKSFEKEVIKLNATGNFDYQK